MNTPRANTKAQLRMRLLMIGLLLGCIVAVTGLEFLLRMMGSRTYLPLRLVLFVALGCSISICIFLGQIIVISRRHSDPRVMRTEGSFMSDLLRILGGYAVIEASVSGIVFITTEISLTQVLWAYLLFLVPALLGIPPICRARQLTRNPKLSALWFTFATVLYVPSIVAASVFSGTYGWLGVPMGHGEWIFATAFGTAIAAASSYYSAYKSLSRRKLSEQEQLP